MTNKQERRAKIQGYISLILAGMPARLPGREVSLSPASARPAPLEDLLGYLHPQQRAH